MAVAERPIGFSLWISTPLPDDRARWERLDTGADRATLERQAASLAPLLRQRRLAVVDGLEPPRWRPML